MNSPQTLSILFALLVLATTGVRLWLDLRQGRHITAHRGAVPNDFVGVISLSSHQRAADYSRARLRLSLVTTLLTSATLLGWTLLGGLDALQRLVHGMVGTSSAMAYQLALVVAFTVIGSLIELPISLVNTFVLEQRFGFNRTTWRLWLIDALKGMALSLIIGLPLLALVLWLMDRAGPSWWWWAWLALSGFQLTMMVLYPAFIAPWFNKFAPLDDPSLKAHVEGLMARCGFRAKGFFVMDGSRRSAHANAYFTGIGAAKRVVFYDTLLNRLNPGEVEAVLAHELGHFHHRHVRRRLIMVIVMSLGAFAALGWLASSSWFYEALGVTPRWDAPPHALALLLFMLVLPPLTYFVSPWLARMSRRDEFQADAFACAHAQGADLKQALLKLYEDNAGTLTPDPLYVAFYASHPPAAQRLAAIAALSNTSTAPVSMGNREATTGVRA